MHSIEPWVCPGAFLFPQKNTFHAKAQRGVSLLYISDINLRRKGSLHDEYKYKARRTKEKKENTISATSVPLRKMSSPGLTSSRLTSRQMSTSEIRLIYFWCFHHLIQIHLTAETRRRREFLCVSASLRLKKYNCRSSILVLSQEPTYNL